MLARKLSALLLCVVPFLATATASAAEPVPIPGLNLTPGVVQSPPLGLTLHGDLVVPDGTEATASARPLAGAVERFTTPDGYAIKVETSTGYIADPARSAELVAFMDSLLHGSELDKLTIFVALPEEIRGICGGPAAACYFSSRDTIYFVGQPSFGGFPTSYVVAHEYGHRIADNRRNPPFRGGALAWGTKRWASYEQVCRKTVQGVYAPGAEIGNDYYRNPGEAFAEAYAWQHYGSALVRWEFIPSLRPNGAAIAALERDVLEPWAPVLSEIQGSISRPGKRKVYPLTIENDGWVKVQMTGGGDLDIGLKNSAGRFVAASVKPGTGREHFNFLTCGERKMKLVVEDVRLPGDFRLQISLP